MNHCPLQTVLHRSKPHHLPHAAGTRGPHNCCASAVPAVYCALAQLMPPMLMLRAPRSTRARLPGGQGSNRNQASKPPPPYQPCAACRVAAAGGCEVPLTTSPQPENQRGTPGATTSSTDTSGAACAQRLCSARLTMRHARPPSLPPLPPPPRLFIALQPMHCQPPGCRCPCVRTKRG